ncbi:MAG: hypothetical protein MUC59_14905 [Saprospiraceae bacterium]|jgi:hypothetical protein|nr:hypothetical protein [Saprospiraceae bacterium]
MENPVLKNILIVESFNDSAFIRLLLNDLGLTFGIETQVAAGTEIIDLHKFPDPDNPDKELRGKEAIGKKLKSIKGDLLREKYGSVDRLGIILDFDDMTIEVNLKLVNNAIQGAFGQQPPITKEGEFIDAAISLGGEHGSSIPLQIACFFTKDSSGAGNLDTLLFEICQNPQKPVPYADCLAHWRDCVNESESQLKVSSGLFTKMWVSNFLRAKAREHDKAVLSDFEAKQSELLLNHGSQMFDLKHPSLATLSEFLLNFKPSPEAPSPPIPA